MAYNLRSAKLPCAAPPSVKKKRKRAVRKPDVVKAEVGHGSDVAALKETSEVTEEDVNRDMEEGTDAEAGHCSDVATGSITSEVQEDVETDAEEEEDVVSTDAEADHCSDVATSSITSEVQEDVETDTEEEEGFNREAEAGHCSDVAIGSMTLEVQEDVDTDVATSAAATGQNRDVFRILDHFNIPRQCLKGDANVMLTDKDICVDMQLVIPKSLLTMPKQHVRRVFPDENDVLDIIRTKHSKTFKDNVLEFYGFYKHYIETGYLNNEFPTDKQIEIYKKKLRGVPQQLKAQSASNVRRRIQRIVANLQKEYN